MRKLQLKFTKLFTVLLAFIFVLSACSTTKKEESKKEEQKKMEMTLKGELNVFAAVSMTDALNEIKAEFEKNYPDVKIKMNLDSSGKLQKQIEEGAPCDVFISAGKKQIKSLEEKGLLDNGTIKDLLENKLVLIKNAKAETSIKSLADIKDGKELIIGDDHVPAGQYAKAYFEKKGILADVEKEVSKAKNVREVLAQVVEGARPFGMVYKTDAVTELNKNTIVVVEEINSDDIGQKILYPMAMIKAIKNKELAEEYMKFLTSPEAVKAFEKQKFEVIK